MRYLSLSLVLGALVGTSVMLSQQRPFEVASIKPVDRSNAQPLRIFQGCHGTDSRYQLGAAVAPPPLGHCVLRGSVKTLIAAAYDLQGLPQQLEQLITGPGWTGSDLFELDAKAEDPGAVTEEQLKEMLRTLLATRFQLQFHRETKDVSGYELVVAKGGVKMSNATGDERPQGILRMGPRFTGNNVNLAELAVFLSGRLGEPVIDRTQLSGRYSFNLAWTSNNAAAGPLGASTPSTSTEPSEGSIFTAVQEQLGLRLQSRKVSIEVFAIDRVEKPTQ